MNAVSIGYHNIADDNCGAAPNKLLYTLSNRNFCEQMNGVRVSLGRDRIRTIDSLRQWSQDVPVFLTFDDGDIGGYTCAAEILERNAWRGHFFIVTDWIGRRGFMDRAQIRELHARGHVIGSHTCSHPERMSSLSWSELIHEWSDSISALGDLLGAPVKTASVANGFYSQRVGKAAAACNVEVLFTSEPVTSAHREDDALILGRFSVKRNAPPGLSGALASGKYWPRLQQAFGWRARKTVKALAGESYLTVRRILLSGFNPAGQ